MPKYPAQLVAEAAARSKKLRAARRALFAYRYQYVVLLGVIRYYISNWK